MINPARYIPVFAVALTSLCQADPGEAERFVREGKPWEALNVLQAKGDALSAEDLFWKGQALLRLKRYEEGAYTLAKVPASHPFYAYAARGIIYCAWKSPRINFLEALGHININHDDELAQLVIASMSEYQLKATKMGDLSAYKELKKMAEQNVYLLPMVKVLSIQEFRRKQEYSEGIAYAKKLEHDSSLSPLMRQRIRLELAELYYDKEKYAPEPPPDAEDAEESGEGIGEETLLQFITANPESPLLEEAFRRLYRHSSGVCSEYTREKLGIWISDTAHPHRAALAILYKFVQKNTSDAVKASLANSASTELPGEPLTYTILHEYLRELLTHGKDAEAKRYLEIMDSLPKQQPESARALFFRAYSLREEPARAMELFSRCAQLADGELQPVAMTNALICALRCGDSAMVGRLLEAPAFITSQRALHLAYTGLILENDPEKAQEEIAKMEHMHPTLAQAVDMRLDKALLAVQKNPARAYAALCHIQPQERAEWTESQTLRYAALLEKAADMQDFPEEKIEALLFDLYSQAPTISCKQRIMMHLAGRLSRVGKHRDALQRLLSLEKLLPPGLSKATAVLYAGYEASLLGSMEDLSHALSLYEECARMHTELTPKAILAQASILVRINRTQEAFALLEQFSPASPTLSPEDNAHRLSIIADAFGYELEQKGADALLACEQIENIPGLALEWKLRARLQHACFCTRLGKNSDALDDYQKVMDDLQLEIESRSDSPFDYVYYYAGAGAVYELICLQRANDAAVLAEKLSAIASQNAADPSSDPQSKSAAFSRWARSIRRAHFLPMPDEH